MEKYPFFRVPSATSPVDDFRFGGWIFVGDFDELEGHDPAAEEVVAEPVKDEKKEDKQEDKAAEKSAPKKS